MKALKKVTSLQITCYNIVHVDYVRDISDEISFKDHTSAMPAWLPTKHAGNGGIGVKILWNIYRYFTYL